MHLKQHKYSSDICRDKSLVVALFVKQTLQGKEGLTTHDKFLSLEFLD